MLNLDFEIEACHALIELKHDISYKLKKNIKWNLNIYTIVLEDNQMCKIYLNTEIYSSKIDNVYYIQKFIFNNNYDILQYYILIFPQELKDTIEISICQKNNIIKRIKCSILNIYYKTYPKNFYPSLLINESQWIKNNLKNLL